MKKVLVTGSSGYFSSFICPIVKTEYELVPYDIKDGDDLFDEENLAKKIEGCYGVIHLAAHPHFLPSISEERFQHLNVEGTMRLFEAAVKAGVKKFLYTSSGATYGYDAGFVAPKEFPVPLSHTGNRDKLNAYGRSKVDAEKFLRENAGGSDMQVAAFRVNWPQGNIPGPLKDKHLHDCTTQDFVGRVYLKALNTNFPEPYQVFNTCKAEMPGFDSSAFVASRFPDAENNLKPGDSLVYVQNRLDILGM